jgi:hypothetical protein
MNFIASAAKVEPTVRRKKRDRKLFIGCRTSGPLIRKHQLLQDKNSKYLNGLFSDGDQDIVSDLLLKLNIPPMPSVCVGSFVHA